MQHMIIKSWEEFKNVCIKKKSLSLQYREIECNNSYEIFCAEANTFFWCVILIKDTPEAVDFEANYKSSANQPIEFKNLVGQPKRKGFFINIAPTEMEGIVDIKFNKNVYLKDGWLYSTECNAEDKFSANIISKNDSTILVPKIVEDVRMLPNKMINILSNENVKFSNDQMIRITYTKGGNIDTVRCISVVADYYEEKEFL